MQNAFDTHPHLFCFAAKLRNFCLIYVESGKKVNTEKIT